jgi:hypothetical protein
MWCVDSHFLAVEILPTFQDLFLGITIFPRMWGATTGVAGVEKSRAVWVGLNASGSFDSGLRPSLRMTTRTGNGKSGNGGQGDDAARARSAHGLFSQTVPKPLGAVSRSFWNSYRSGPSPWLPDHHIIQFRSFLLPTDTIHDANF